LIRLGFGEEIPGGASYAYVFGSATLITFIGQIPAFNHGPSSSWQSSYLV
jgi:hypothetical protein